MEVEANACQAFVRSALEELKNHPETLKIFGCYNVLSVVIIFLSKT